MFLFKVKFKNVANYLLKRQMELFHEAQIKLYRWVWTLSVFVKKRHN